MCAQTPQVRSTDTWPGRTRDLEKGPWAHRLAEGLSAVRTLGPRARWGNLRHRPRLEHAQMAHTPWTLRLRPPELGKVCAGAEHVDYLMG